MKLLIVSATMFEVAPLKEYLQENFVEAAYGGFVRGELEVLLLCTGVGLPLTSFVLGKLISDIPFDLAVNAGVCGAFDRNLMIGDVVEVTSEEFGDLGVEEADGSFTGIHQLGLIDPDRFPFKNGKLYNPRNEDFDFLPKVKGTSVNRVHGYQASIDQFIKRSDAQVESMEGAAFFYACLIEKAAFIEVRAVSNYVEPRNRDNWNLPLAIDNLNNILIEMVDVL
jgi:futalosine hydrolase